MGRPRKEINWEEFDRLCAIQCTQAEIAAWFGCTTDTIANAVKREQGTTFADYYAERRLPGLVSLRRQQFQLALGGNVPMLIWLGKQLLGQRDRAEMEWSERPLLLLDGQSEQGVGDDR